jgi:hypothetical protein
MRFKASWNEIFYLTILFTALALYLDIHGEKGVYNFIVNHIIALVIALLVSKIIYRIVTKIK